MIREALEYLVGLGQIKTLGIGGQTYSPEKLQLITTPAPQNIELTTLTGLIDYIDKGIDIGFHLDNIFLHVASPTEVRVYSSLCNDATRHMFIVCKPILPKIALNIHIDIEQMNVMLQSCFVQTDDIANVLKVVGNIREEQVQTIGDNGVSQSVVAKAGIATVEDVNVPNPVNLAPYRSFPEIEQVESKFILRMKSGPTAALYEADGGIWRVEAANRIVAYLSEKMPNLKIIA